MPDGTVENWAIEAGSPNILLRRGITRDTLKVGQKIVRRRLSVEGRVRTGPTAGISRCRMGRSCSSDLRAPALRTKCSGLAWTPRNRERSQK